MKQINQVDLDRVGGGMQFPGQTQPYFPEPLPFPYPGHGFPIPGPDPLPLPYPDVELL